MLLKLGGGHPLLCRGVRRWRRATARQRLARTVAADRGGVPDGGAVGIAVSQGRVPWRGGGGVVARATQNPGEGKATQVHPNGASAKEVETLWRE